MTESAALLVDEVFPNRPTRQWVLSFPYPLRFLFAHRPEVRRVPASDVSEVLVAELMEFIRQTAD